MKALYIEETDDSPKVIMDKENKMFEISGKSLPEDVSKFYDPILAWLEKYSTDPLPETYLKINLEYFNTASSKLLLDVFMILEGIKENGSVVEINWYYPWYDEEMKDAGVEYSEMVDIKFNLILEKEH